jgi:hypothetical protein
MWLGPLWKGRQISPPAEIQTPGPSKSQRGDISTELLRPPTSSICFSRKQFTHQKSKYCFSLFKPLALTKLPVQFSSTPLNQSTKLISGWTLCMELPSMTTLSRSAWFLSPFWAADIYWGRSNSLSLCHSTAVFRIVHWQQLHGVCGLSREERR